MEPECSGGARRQLLTAWPLGQGWLSRMEPRGRLWAALGSGERERDRGRRSEAGRARSATEIGAMSPDGVSKRDCRPCVTTSSTDSNEASCTASCRSSSDVGRDRVTSRKTAAGRHRRTTGGQPGPRERATAVPGEIQERSRRREPGGSRPRPRVWIQRSGLGREEPA